jgi:hypothetical protein
MYGMFYFTFVPSPEHEGQIFLEFEPYQEVPGMHMQQMPLNKITLSQTITDPINLMKIIT